MPRTSEIPTNLRLYVPERLAAGGKLTLSGNQAHYLLTVMRRKAGDDLTVFNGTDGEWRGVIEEAGKKQCLILLEGQIRPPTPLPNVWLVFAPVKRARLDFIAQKATEMGVAAIQPVITRRTVVTRVNEARLLANSIKAAEQCGLVSVPEIRSTQPLEALLDTWPQDRRLLFCDESGTAPAALSALETARKTTRPGPWAVLIGPEGGFAEAERARIARLPFTLAISLGPRIMRADTAAIAALALWQATLGDWDPLHGRG